MKSFTIGDKHFVTIRAPKDKEKGAFVIDISAFVPMSAYTDRFFHGTICVSFNKARRLRDLINSILGEAEELELKPQLRDHGELPCIVSEYTGPDNS